MKQIILIAIALMLVGGEVKADNIAIICKDPKGWTFEKKNGPPKLTKDQFVGTTFSYQWDTSGRIANVILQNSKSAGGTPEANKALVFSSPSYISFTVVYSNAIWTHTYFKKAGTMIISKHSDGYAFSNNAAAGYIFHAKCSIGN